MLAILSADGKDTAAMKEPLQFLKRSFRMILPSLLVMALIYGVAGLLSPGSKTAALHLMTGWSGVIWWIGVIGVGVVLPWVLVMRPEAIKVKRAWPLLASVLLGGFLLRFVVVFAGQGAL